MHAATVVACHCALEKENMGAVDGDICPDACAAACAAAESARNGDGVMIALIVLLCVLLLVDASIAALALYSIGREVPRTPAAVAVAPGATSKSGGTSHGVHLLGGGSVACGGGNRSVSGGTSGTSGTGGSGGGGGGGGLLSTAHVAPLVGGVCSMGRANEVKR